MEFRITVCALSIAATLISCDGGTPSSDEGSRPLTVLPLVSVDGMPFVSVRTDGSGSHLWLLDSGFESSVVNSRFADSLRLQSRATTQQAAPGGAVEIARIAGIPLHLGSATFTPDSLDVIDLHQVEPLLGVSYAGILGHDFLLKYVTRIDYEKKQVVLFAPATFKYTGAGMVLPIWIEAAQPFVLGLLYSGGRAAPGKIKIDTGSLDVLGLNGSFVQQSELVGKETQAIPAMGSAIGGKVDAFVVRLDSLVLGTTTIAKPIAGYSVSTERRGDAGTMGVGLLGRFNLVFDYARHRLIMEETSRSHEPMSYDASGLLLAATTPDFRGIKVFSVDPKSPAESAGIRVGDTVITVDGTPASELGLTAIRARLTQPQSVRLGIIHQGQPRDISLPLKRRL